MSAAIPAAGRIAALLGGLMLCCGLGGCPNDSPPTAPAQPVTPTLSGTVSIDGTPLSGALVVIKGSAGQVRETSTDSAGHYSMPLANLTGPYFVEAAGVLHSAVMAAGIADATPLTELAFINVVNQDTHLYFVNLDMTFSDNGEFGDGSSDPSLFTASGLADGQTAALRFIKSVYGVLPAAGIGDLFDSSFQAVASDPMAQTLKAYSDAVAASGVNYSILQQNKLCETSDVTITRDGDSVDFCQLSAKVGPAAGNPAASVYEFFTQSQDHIVVTAQDSQVLSVEFTPHGGATYSCAAAACSGVTLGDAGSDGNRPLLFSTTVLTAAGTTATLSGNLIAGTTFPELICSGQQFYFRQGGTYTGGDCVASPYETTSFARAIYTFPGSGSVGSLEIRLDGDTVVNVLHYGSDANGQLLPLFKCRFTDCGSVTVSAADASGNRTITLDGTSLSAVQADGSLSSASTEQVNAVLTLQMPFTFEPSPCPDTPYASFTLNVAGAAPFVQCLPDAQYRYALPDGDGSISYVFSYFTTITVVATDTTVQSVGVDLFTCAADACAGTTVSAVDPSTDMRTVSFANTSLGEVETGGLPGDRTLVINGSSLTPTSNCILNGVCP